VLIRAFVVDDEHLAVQRLTRLLTDTGRVAVSGSATDPHDALAARRSADVDVVFLDIQMPEMTGFDLIEQLDRNIPVVFTTAYDRYALEAFAVNSIDYLLKPVEAARLEKALDKLERLRGQAPPDIRELAKQLGSTVLYVTHDQIEAMAMSDKIALMQSGELLQVGRPMELYHRPARAEVAEFFGSVNWLKGKIVGSSLAETPIGRLGIRECARPGEDVLVGFRPEALTVVEDHRATDSNVLQATLRTSTFLGDQFIYSVEVRDQSLVGKGRSIPAQKDGKLYLYVHPEDVMVFPAGQKTGLTVLEQTTRPV